MDDLWKAIGELAAAMHTDRIASIADAIACLKGAEAFERVKPFFGPNADPERVERMRLSWLSQPTVTASEVSAAFRGAAEVTKLMDGKGAVELVWTGPKTGLIPTRRTEQVILEVIESARDDVFLVSYVFYKASRITDAMNTAITRGTTVKLLLESSTAHGGAVKGDSVKAMAKAVPGAMIYVWDQRAQGADGRAASGAVHAKCVVADGALAFLTSANLTSAALERNMELGVLIRGGTIPAYLAQHLEALISTEVICSYQ